MNQIGKITLFLFFISPYIVPSQTIDTLFFETLKSFYNQKTAYNLNRSLFTKWAKNDSEPFNYIYVSKLNRVENVLEDDDYIYAGQDTVTALEKQGLYLKKGFSVFHYKSFGTSDAKITRNLLMYPAEAKAFIVFHELTHNYFNEKKTGIAYDLNEAACDVVAVNFSKQILKEKQILSKRNLKRGTEALESIYKTINLTIYKISVDSLNYLKYCSNAENKIKKKLKNCDTFFMNRFNYNVTTAYLLKNQNYCRNYFVVSQLYLKSKSFGDFINGLINLSKKNI